MADIQTHSDHFVIIGAREDLYLVHHILGCAARGLAVQLEVKEAITAAALADQITAALSIRP